MFTVIWAHFVVGSCTTDVLAVISHLVDIGKAPDSIEIVINFMMRQCNYMQ